MSATCNPSLHPPHLSRQERGSARSVGARVKGHPFMSSTPMRSSSIALLAALALAPVAAADTVTVGASKDNSIFENSSELSNGHGDGMFCGRTGIRGNLSVRRALIAFDV